MATFKSKFEMLKELIIRKINRAPTKERLYSALLESKRLLEEKE
jgi:TnpA family transposase